MTSSSENKALTYEAAGVSIDRGNQLVDAIRPFVAATQRKGVMDSIGGFGGLFDLKACGYSDPVLVAGTDGVGTKLKIAIEAQKHDTVGIDLVAMCVNDLVVQGAEPLFFLDYFATGTLSVEVAGTVVKGIAEGCKQAGCALIGGETAEMPGMYSDGDYDLAGFAVGAVERAHILPRQDLAEGDVVLGIASSGIHSNGYSLVRKIVERTGLTWQDNAPFDNNQALADALLTPTKIYIRSCLAAIQTGGVKALAHITGGGLLENIPRVLPKELGVQLTAGSWDFLPVFQWLQEAGQIENTEMWRSFNCGVGMVLVVKKDKQSAVTSALKEAGETVFTLGEVTARGAQAVVIS